MNSRQKNCNTPDTDMCYKYMEKSMKRNINKAFILIICASICLTGCTTINKLESYDLSGSSIALDLQAPTGPVVNVDYHLSGHDDPPLLAAVKMGTNLIKAGEAKKTEEKLYAALKGLYLPEFVAELTFDRTVKTLEAEMIGKKSGADVIQEIDIEEYGIQTWSSSGYVSMMIEMTARLYHTGSREVIWQRRVSADDEITPAMFGFDHLVGNFVTIASLSSLEEDQLSKGFKKLMIEIAGKTIGVLQDDLREARRR